MNFTNANIKSAKFEEGDTHTGDDKRYVCKVEADSTIIPRELKEQRAIYVQKIADIDAALAILEAVK